MDIRVFKDKDELLEAMYQRLADAFESPSVSDIPAGVMLSGGNTPKPLFDRFAEGGIVAADNVYALYTDDRLVDVASGDSNYGNSLGMLNGLTIPDERTVHLDSGLSLQDATTAYEAGLRRFYDNDGVITLGILGLGPDGHTCSIFTKDDAVREDRLAFAVPNRLGYDRVTVSRAVLGMIQSIIFLAAGDDKREKLNALLSDPLSIPAGIAVDGHPDIEVWTDVQL